MSESGRKKRITQAQNWKDEAQGRVDQAIGDLHTWKGLQEFRDPSTTLLETAKLAIQDAIRITAHANDLDGSSLESFVEDALQEAE